MSRHRSLSIVICILSLTLAGCNPAPAKLAMVSAAPTPPITTTASEESAFSATAQTALRDFLANDFSAAQKSMRFQTAELNDPTTQRMFTDFSRHLNKRLALDAVSAGKQTSAPVVSVANIRVVSAAMGLADVSVRAADGLEPLNFLVKIIRAPEGWALDFASFMLALIDVLDE